MKKLGLIYKYNEDEKKGILVYGHWQTHVHNQYLSHNMPVKFTLDNCKSTVKTGQLVYFTLDDNTARNIEPASLSNFDIELMKEITKWDNSDKLSGWYNRNTHIIYENLNNVIIPELPEFNTSGFYDEDDEDVELNYYEDVLLSICEEKDEDDQYDYSYPYQEFISPELTNLPQEIDALYNIFGNYKHRTSIIPNNCVNINLLDISMWVDESILGDKYFGSNVDEVIQLYDIFVNKIRIDNNGNEYIPQKTNNYISDSWKLLLSHFNNNELCQIIQKAPLLQPALPYSFCINNIDSLSDAIGMPDIKICKAYCMHLVAKTNSASDFKLLCNRFKSYFNCEKKHAEGEGFYICNLDNRSISNIRTKLYHRFNNNIVPNIQRKFNCFTGVKLETLESENQKFSNDDYVAIGSLLDILDNINTCTYEFKQLYQQIPKECYETLNNPIRVFINKMIIATASNKQNRPSTISTLLVFSHALTEWIDDATKECVIETMNDCLPYITDISDLKEAYELGLITGKNFFKRFCRLTKRKDCFYIVNIVFLDTEYVGHFPLIIQWYAITKLLKHLNFKSTMDYMGRCPTFSDISIHDIRSLIGWLESQSALGNISKIVLNKAKYKIISGLTDTEKMELFEEGISTTPGSVNIEKEVFLAYKKRLRKTKHFKEECFQDYIYNKVLSSYDYNFCFFVIKHLDLRHQILLRNKVGGLLKLYIWILNPDEEYDIDLIFSYYSKLPCEQQIKLFRYIIYLIGSNKISYTVNDLYDMFVLSQEKACPAICGLLFFLKMKIKSHQKELNSKQLEDMFNNINQIKDFLLVKDFFYSCSGHLAYTYIRRDIEYHTYNGCLKKEQIDNNLFYIIEFYDRPKDVHGRDVTWLGEDTISLAKTVLETHIEVIITNNKYYIHQSEEIALKQFVIAYDIDDLCCLLDEKSMLVDGGFLPPLNSYQPFYTNRLVPYERHKYYVCRGFNYLDIEPENGLPFYWCNKKPCARKCHYIQPISEWEHFKFADILYILSPKHTITINQIWDISSEVSQFLNDLYINIEGQNNSEKSRNNQIITSHITSSSDEVGFLSEKISVIQNLSDNDDEEDDFLYDDDECDYDDEQTYDRYNGTYAQDEMGYSDDDIDTVLDGDPSAYWNID